MGFLVFSFQIPKTSVGGVGLEENCSSLPATGRGMGRRKRGPGGGGGGGGGGGEGEGDGGKKERVAGRSLQRRRAHF